MKIFFSLYNLYLKLIFLKLEKMKKLLVIHLIMVSLINYSYADEFKLSIKEAMKTAIKNNSSLKQARSEWLSASYQKDLVNTNKFPKIGVDISAFMINEMETDNDPMTVTLPGLPPPNNTVTVPPFNQTTPDHLYKAELSITQPLYLGGTIKNNLEATNQLKNNKHDILMQTKQDVLFQTVAAYFIVVRAQNSYAVEEKIINLSKKNLEDVQVKYEAKAVTKYELIRAEADVLEAESAYHQAYSDLQNAKFELANILHITPDFTTTDSFSFVECEPEVDKEIAYALKNRYDIKSFSKLYSAFDAQAKAVDSEYKPQLFFSATGGAQNPEMGLFGGEDTFGPTYQVGLVMKWNIFDGSKKKSRKQIIENDKFIWKAKQQLLTEKIKEEIRKACVNIVQSKKLVDISMKSQLKAGEVFDLVSTGYQNQKNTQLELLDARLQMSRSYRDLVNATFRHELARVQLDYLKGKFSEDTNPLVK